MSSLVWQEPTWHTTHTPNQPTKEDLQKFRMYGFLNHFYFHFLHLLRVTSQNYTLVRFLTIPKDHLVSTCNLNSLNTGSYKKVHSLEWCAITEWWKPPDPRGKSVGNKLTPHAWRSWPGRAGSTSSSFFFASSNFYVWKRVKV